MICYRKFSISQECWGDDKHEQQPKKWSGWAEPEPEPEPGWGQGPGPGLKMGFIRSYQDLQVLTRLKKAIIGPQGPYEAFEGLTRLLRTLQGP